MSSEEDPVASIIPQRLCTFPAVLSLTDALSRVHWPLNGRKTKFINISPWFARHSPPSLPSWHVRKRCLKDSALSARCTLKSSSLSVRGVDREFRPEERTRGRSRRQESTVVFARRGGMRILSRYMYVHNGVINGTQSFNDDEICLKNSHESRSFNYAPLILHASVTRKCFAMPESSLRCHV